MQISISMVKINVVMACKILKSLNVVVHAKLSIQRGLCNEIKIPERKMPENKLTPKNGLEDHALPSHHCYSMVQEL